MNRPAYFIFYDGDCRVCVRTRKALEGLGSDADLHFVDINDPDAIRQFPQVDHAAACQQMMVLDPHGFLSGGYDGVVSLTRVVPALRFLEPILRWRPLRKLGWCFYRWLARNRYRLGRSIHPRTQCSVQEHITH